MATKIDEAFIELTVKDKKLRKGLKDAEKQVDSLGKSFMNLKTLAAGAFAGTSIIRFMRSATRAAMAQIQAEQKLAGVLKATGNAAGFSAKELNRYAAELQKVTTFGDEVTISAMGLLSTFDQIQGGVFTDTIRLAQDLAVAMGQDLNSAVLQLGKALQDPVRGMNALSRSGVIFDEQTTKLIKSLSEENELLKAQEIMLAAVRKQFGGLSEEMAKTTPGRIEQLNNRFGDIMESIGTSAIGFADRIGALDLAERAANPGARFGEEGNRILPGIFGSTDLPGIPGKGTLAKKTNLPSSFSTRTDAQRASDNEITEQAWLVGQRIHEQELFARSKALRLGGEQTSGLLGRGAAGIASLLTGGAGGVSGGLAAFVKTIGRVQIPELEESRRRTGGRRVGVGGLGAMLQSQLAAGRQDDIRRQKDMLKELKDQTPFLKTISEKVGTFFQ